MDATNNFECSEGTGYECTEDVGGYVGWEDFKAGYRATYPTKKRECMNWYENTCSSGNGLGLETATIVCGIGRGSTTG
jgi:hypothetical protein